MWTNIWTYIKNPKNIAITLLAVVVVLLSIYATGQYIALGVKDVRLAKQDQVLKTKDATIDALTTENKQLTTAIKQTKIQVEKERKLRIQVQNIRDSIKEGMTDEETIAVHSNIIDLFNRVQ